MTLQKDLWLGVNDARQWPSVSAEFLELHDRLNIDITKERPYNFEAAVEMCEFFQHKLGSESLYQDFVKVLARLRVEHYQLKKREQAEKCEEEAKKCEEEAKKREEEAKKREEEAKRQQEDEKLLEQYIMVEDEDPENEFVMVEEDDAESLDENWEEVEKTWTGNTVKK